MPINIKDENTEENIRKLAALQGKTITAAVADAVEAQLKRRRNRPAEGNRLQAMLAVAHHCASLPELDKRTAEEILGYDEDGLPH